ncbi:MAG: acyl-CoA dehydrogenase family protein [Dehalococcoidia bacterium]
MDLELTEEQQLLKNSARDFFERELPKEKVKEIEFDPLGYSPELWKKMAELGWCGLTIPEKYGGAEFGLMELVMLLDEMGKAALPSPYFSSTVLCAPLINMAGSEEQKSELLPRIASGESIFAFALTETTATYEPDGIETRATVENDSYILNGTKLFIHDAHCADYIICAARTRVWTTPEEGISIFLVDPKSPGITITPLQTIANDHQNEITFDNVSVPAANLIGELDQGWPTIKKVLDQAIVAKCAEMIGGCDWAVEASVEYAKERVQYGHPIGAYGIIQHYLADMWMECSMGRRLTYYAAWALQEGENPDLILPATKRWVNESFKHCTRMGVQIHGGIATTMDHDMGIYYRRARQAALLFGDTEISLQKVAGQLGL